MLTSLKACRQSRRLQASVHRKDHIIYEYLGDWLGETAKDAVVEHSRGKDELLRLLKDGSNDAR